MQRASGGPDGLQQPRVAVEKPLSRETHPAASSRKASRQEGWRSANSSAVMPISTTSWYSPPVNTDRLRRPSMTNPKASWKRNDGSLKA